MEKIFLLYVGNYAVTIRKVRQIKSSQQKSMKAEIILTAEKEKLEMIDIEDFKSVVNATEVKEGSFSVEFV